MKRFYLLANKGKFIIGAVVIGAAFGYFIFMAFQSATIYYFTVSEISEEPQTPQGKTVRVSGKLVPESFYRPENSTEAYFSITDGTNSMSAIHDGILPDLFFNKNSEIILEGVHSPGDSFESYNVIVKCPSKYVAMEEEQKLEESY
ncbi:MAG: cytochrome c maturation protein CcmE [SAR202 cluster bacterium]|nr:cytochrome c maturation protein CcmE [SAR202 cluster bacterium]